MAFISLIFLAVMGVFGIFAVMFIIGIVKHIKVLVAIPVAFLAILILAIAVLIISVVIKRRSYTNVTDKWRNEWWVSDYNAARDVIEELLSDADACDRERFIKTFKQRIQNSEKFQSELDDFFEVYPKGLSQGELKRDGFTSISSSCSAYYSCTLDNKKYYIRVGYTCDNFKPEDIGVEYFYIESDEIYSQKNEYGKKVLVCNT